MLTKVPLLQTFNRPEQEDPLKTAFFRLEIDGFVRLGFSEGTAPKYSADVSEYREGGQNLYVRKSPGLIKVDNIDLKRGRLVAGPGGGSDDFEKWWGQVVNVAAGKGSGQVFRKSIDYVLLNRELKEVTRYRLYEAWPSSYVPFSDLNGADSKDSIESLTITFEWFNRVGLYML